MPTRSGFAAIGIGFLVAACNAASAPTVSPSLTPAATIGTGSWSPSPSPEATIEPPSGPQPTAGPSFPPIDGLWVDDPSPLLIGAAVRVSVSALNLRVRPTVAARSVATLTPDNILAVGDAPPFEADGYVWYSGWVISGTGKLPPLSESPAIVDRLGGWFAASKGSTAYVARLASRCPTVVDLASVAAMLPGERLACFADRSIALQGTFGCAGCSAEISGTYEPAWLASPVSLDLLWVSPAEANIALRFPPGSRTGDEPAFGSIIRVRGHFRDRAAGDCVMTTFYAWERLADDPPLHSVPVIVAHEMCRQQFVVESFEVLGADPSFGMG